MTLQEYINITNTRYQTGISREHSYRGDLQNLLSTLLPGILVTNEPARIACGAPDYILTRKDIPLGYIEAKDIGKALDSKDYKDQFDRYRTSLNNLIITDYLDFWLYRDGSFVTRIAIAEIHNGKILAKSDNFAQFTTLIQNFATHIGQTIKSPTKLAEMMAGRAKMMAKVIENSLHSDDKAQQNSSLKQQMQGFQQILIHDINNKTFADIYAQTIAYGLFAARYHDPTLPTFSREEAATLIPKSNPFLRKLFQYVAGYDLDERLIWIVDELVQIFLATDVADIMHQFGKSTAQHDPVIHFYETFLASYDPALRKARGVWYTPEPVVNFIVRAVDDILKTEFGLTQGLADTTKTKIKLNTQTVDKRSNTGYKQIEQEVHKVQILDPATGTGTFLAEVVKHIYNTKFKSMQGVWSSYVEEHLIPRLNGFELLMTSYAMAHLKLDMLLTETGYKSTKNQRLKIYLTNSLEEHHPDTGTLFASWLSDEANEANHIKRDTPVMVVIGNPPYAVSSSNKSDWIYSLTADYKKDLNERNIQPLSDDYIKFIRFGQHFIDKNGSGVLAYISNNSFIDGIIHRQMRKHLLESFDTIYILDLHGNAKKQESAPDGSKDENVFDIMQGVSINLFVKTGKKKPDAFADVYQYDLFGKREHKYDFLRQNTLKNIDWKAKVKTNKPNFFFIKKDFNAESTYDVGFKLDEIFIKGASGIKTHRDDFVVELNKKALTEKIEKFFNKDYSDSQVRVIFNLKDNRDWKLEEARKDNDFNERKIQLIAYRPFDLRYIYYEKRLIDFGRESLMNHLLFGENLGLITCRQQSTFDFQHIFVAKAMSDINSISLQTKEISFQFPLYLYPNTSDGFFEKHERIPNLNKEIVEKIAAYLDLAFVVEKADQRNTFSPIDLLDYIYSALHSPSYREKYKDFLKIDFPRVPYPKDAATFWQLVDLGGELRQIHLLESNKLDQFITSYPVNGNNIVGKIKYTDFKVYINDTQYFEGVPEVAWNFYIGGYQPAQKWLKDRKDRALTFEDILHYQRIIVALAETDRLMGEIDAIEIE